jgi:uncharacterized membrane protein HdeD (DUF308 family)
MNTVMAATLNRVGVGGRLLVWPALLIVFSVLAIASPLVTSLWAVMIIGWLLIFSSVAQVIHAFYSKGVGYLLWKLFVAVLYFCVGIYFLTDPFPSIMTLTLVFGVFFVVEGWLGLITYFGDRRSDASAWILLEGCVTLILGLLILGHWPSSALWAFGTLIGISMFVTGISRLMISLAARSLREATHSAA